MPRLTRNIRLDVQSELDAAAAADASGAPDTAFRHLERAHVLAQATTVEHVRVHWRMLGWAIRHRRAGEVLGQMWRLPAAAVLTGSQWVPEGNTGGANVSALRSMPMTPDLERIMDDARGACPKCAPPTPSWQSRLGEWVTVARVVLTAILALAHAACSSVPQDLDVSLRHPSAQGRYVVELTPPEATPAINQLHAWHIQLRAADGAPVPGARIAVDGGMPEHGHGLPTRPQVTPEGTDGTYVMDGVKFSMTGRWEIKLAIDAPAGADTVTFNTVVRPPALAR